MLPLKYQAMLLMVVLVTLARQSVAISNAILSDPHMLHVRTEPSRAAILISRTVASTTNTDSKPDDSMTDATNSTKTTAAPQERTTTPKIKMTGVVEIAFAGIRELDNSNVEVGGATHSFNQFSDAKLGFLNTLSAKRNVNELPQVSGSIRGVCQDSEAVLSKAGPETPNATVVANMCALESSGRATRQGEEMKLKNGQFYMSVEVQDWQWCGCDNEQSGQFIEFNLTVKMPEGYKISTDSNTPSNMPLKIALGANATYILVSTRYAAGSTWYSMPTGYPKVVLMNDEATQADVVVRVRRHSEGFSDRVTVITMTVEPGYISSEHVQPPGRTSSAPTYFNTPALMIATAAFLMMAAMFSQH